MLAAARARLDAPPRWAKAVAILGGYAFAFASAYGAGVVRYRLTDNADRNAAAGMYGFGDFILVLFVAFVLSVPPTGLGLWWIRGTRWFWAAAGVILLLGGVASLPLLMVARALLLHALTGR